MTSDEPVTVPPTYDAVFHAEYGRMVALAAAVGGDRSHAEDIAQEALARLGREWGTVGSYERPGAWLRRVTINLALSHRRRLVAEAKALLRMGPPVELDDAPVDDASVWDAVRTLPRNQRAAIALHYLEDASIDTIADVLDIVPATARVHLHRGRTALRERLEEHR